MCGMIPHDYRAIESITFGLNVKPEVEMQIFEMTKYKVKHFYKIKIINDSYSLEKVRLEHLVGQQPVGLTQYINFDNLLTGVSGKIRVN